jgi:hypothetical protein
MLLLLDIHSRNPVHFFCPSGGSWYTCTSGSRFLGCCRTDPCVHDCPDGNLEPASFDPSIYGQFPDEICNIGSQFYTCVEKPSFVGCCKTNPCQPQGCPEGDLSQAYLKVQADASQAFVYSSLAASTSTPSLTSTSASSTLPATLQSVSPVVEPGPTSSSSAKAQDTHQSHKISIILGITVGLLALLVLILLCIFRARIGRFICCCKNHQSSSEATSSVSREPHVEHGKTDMIQVSSPLMYRYKYGGRSGRDDDKQLSTELLVDGGQWPRRYPLDSNVSVSKDGHLSHHSVPSTAHYSYNGPHHGHMGSMGDYGYNHSYPQQPGRVDHISNHSHNTSLSSSLSGHNTHDGLGFTAMYNHNMVRMSVPPVQELDGLGKRGPS